MTELSNGPRHPQDPDPVPSTKATAVLGLGIAAVVTGPLLGGIIPAALALMMARQTRAEVVAAEGFLLCGRKLRVGVVLAWVGLTLAATALVAAAVAGLLSIDPGAGGRDYDSTVN